MKMTVCKSCGAEYDVSLVRCPYCGTADASAEEKEYMGKLEDVRKDLHGQIAKGDRQIKKGMGSTARVIIAVIAAILVLGFAVLWLSAGSEKSRSDRKKAEFLQDQGITTEQETTDK